MDNIVNNEVVSENIEQQNKFSIKKIVTYLFSAIVGVLGFSTFAFASTSGSNDLTNLGTIFTQITTWVSGIVSTITSSPILLTGLALFVVSSVIGLAYKLIRG